VVLKPIPIVLLVYSVTLVNLVPMMVNV